MHESYPPPSISHRRRSMGLVAMAKAGNPQNSITAHGGQRERERDDDDDAMWM